MGQAPRLDDSRPCFCSDPGGLRGTGVSRVHPLRTGASAPHPFGHPPIGPDVRVSPRPAQLVPATVQRDAPRDHSGAPGCAEPEHPARNPLPLPEQRDRRRPGIPGARAPWRDPSPVGSIATRRKGFIMAAGLRRACSSRADCCISCTHGSRTRRATWSRSVRDPLSRHIDERRDTPGVGDRPRMKPRYSALLPCDSPRKAAMRRDTLTIQARYVFPVEGHRSRTVA